MLLGGKVKFSEIISLGDGCSVRYQLDRIKRINQPNFIESSYYFDWLWSDKSFSSNLLSIRSGFSIDRKNFELKVIAGSWQVYQSSTGFYFLHDFIFMNNTVENYTDVLFQFEEQFSDFKNKYEHKANKTKYWMSSDLCVLFVYNLRNESISEDYINEFFSNVSIEHKLLILPEATSQYTVASHPRVIVRPINALTSEWSGSDSEYDRVFNDIEFLVPQRLPTDHT
jgi:hypothetical protein